ncbi:MAG: glycine--tRNA ligase subunit beta [Vicinamibacterales bacterium]
MDRELLIEIGTEELPARWLPGLTAQFGEAVEKRLAEARLAPAEPVETFSTPRRLVVRAARVPERQSDVDDLVMGPPVSAAIQPDGQYTGAAIGFARKQGVEPSALERVETGKGIYLAHRRQVRGKATVDVLPDVLGAALRDLQYPKQMRWDALLEDGRGELLSGRPIRWVLFLYGGRVVPFDITRTALASSPMVQDIRSGAVTFGHRFLTTSGRAGRAIKVKGFDDYRRRLAENFVVVERGERHDRIARELDAEARRRGGRVAQSSAGQEALAEVPDLVEYPAVISGIFAEEFLELPAEVLTTTMIHHQHFFPLESSGGALMPAFLAVLNMEPERPELVARNLERVLTARLRDARFFWDADRQKTLEQHRERLATVAFHQGLGSYRDKADRVEPLARWIAADVLGRPEAADDAAKAARWCKADLATDMVRELTELQGAMGGIYAREDGQAEPVWKAIYHHYLPVAVEASGAPSRADLGAAAVSWAAVSLADKADTLAAMFVAGERPTGSRDPHGLRRAAQGLVRLLADLPELTGIDKAVSIHDLTLKAFASFSGHEGLADAQMSLALFMLDRVRSVFEQRGADVRNVRAVIAHQGALVPLTIRRRLDVLPEFTETADFKQLAVLFKRVRNIAKQLPITDFSQAALETEPIRPLTEPAEVALADEIARRRPVIDGAVAAGDGYRKAFAEAAGFGPGVARFFDDVMVMADDPAVRRARLLLLRRLESLILQLADVSEMVPQTE